jgi:hypothetical protein
MLSSVLAAEGVTTRNPIASHSEAVHVKGRISLLLEVASASPLAHVFPRLARRIWLVLPASLHVAHTTK